MGYIVHHAIVVIGFQDEAVIAAHDEAARLFEGIAPVTPPMQTNVNRYTSFAVLPDGSKEGWAQSDRGDAARQALKVWIEAARDREFYLSFAEVAMPEDGPAVAIACDHLAREVAA